MFVWISHAPYLILSTSLVMPTPLDLEQPILAWNVFLGVSHTLSPRGGTPALPILPLPYLCPY